MRHESVQIDCIKIPRGRRRAKDDKVHSLAQSIASIGLLQPIGVTPDYRLVYGLHRIKAVELLKRRTIDCVFIEADALRTELAEIDENVERNALEALEWSQTLKRRKEIYEALHPEAKAGAAGGNAKATNAKSALVEKTPSFTADTAEKTGASQRTIQEDVAIAENISEGVQKQIADLPIADNKGELKRLAALPEKDQEKVAEKLKSGKAETVREALPKSTAKPKTGRGEPTIDARKFKALEDSIGKCVRLNTELKQHAGGPAYHESIRVHLNESLKVIKDWRKSVTR